MSYKLEYLKQHTCILYNICAREIRDCFPLQFATHSVYTFHLKYSTYLTGSLFVTMQTVSFSLGFSQIVLKMAKD